MTIEFHCRSCNNLMRTPDGTGGKKGKCPTCGAVMEIPLRSERPSASLDPAPAAPSDTIEFACPHCSNPVRIPASLAGKKGKCPKCLQVVRIREKSPVSESQETPDKRWKQPEGQAAINPSAAKAMAKPAKASGRPQSPQPAKPAESPAKKSQPDKSSNSIEVPCTKCGRKVRTPATAAGKKARCPACGSIFIIPKAQTKPTAKPGSPGLTILADEPGGLTPVDDLSGGLTPMDGGLVPLDLGGLSPVTGGEGLTPLGDDPLGGDLTPLGGAGLGPLGTDPLGSPGWNSATPAMNPYTAPATYSKPRRSSGSTPALVTAPGIAMMVVAGLSLMVAVVSLAAEFLGASFTFIATANELAPKNAAYQIGQIGGYVAMLCVQIVVLIGGISMIRMRGYGIAMTGAILSILPCSLCCIGFPVGLWALIVLCQADIKSSFS